jgi:hypothetical protein
VLHELLLNANLAFHKYVQFDVEIISLVKQENVNIEMHYLIFIMVSLTVYCWFA